MLYMKILKVEESLEQEKRSKVELDRMRRKIQQDNKLIQQLLADRDR
jgi:hypothetical protein